MAKTVTKASSNLYYQAKFNVKKEQELKNSLQEEVNKIVNSILGKEVLIGIDPRSYIGIEILKQSREVINQYHQIRDLKNEVKELKNELVVLKEMTVEIINRLNN